MSRKARRYRIEHFWRNDPEDTTVRWFPTVTDAWAYVVGEIRKRTRNFAGVEGAYGETVIDFRKLKVDLITKRYATCCYRQCPSWYDNWFLKEYQNGNE